MVRTRFALILYFRMVAHKAACHTLSKAFLKSMKTRTDSAGVGGTFHTGFYDGPNGSRFISILLHNSEFRILNSEFRIPKFALRISEFGIVKYI